MKALTLVSLIAFASLASAQEVRLVDTLESTPPLVCSPLARIAHLQGTVKLSVEVKTGQIEKIESQDANTIETSQTALTKMMMELVKKFKFKPSFTGKINVNFVVKMTEAPENIKTSELKTSIDWQINNIEISYSIIKSNAKPPVPPSA